MALSKLFLLYLLCIFISMSSVFDFKWKSGFNSNIKYSTYQVLKVGQARIQVGTLVYGRYPVFKAGLGCTWVILSTNTLPKVCQNGCIIKERLQLSCQEYTSKTYKRYNILWLEEYGVNDRFEIIKEHQKTLREMVWLWIHAASCNEQRRKDTKRLTKPWVKN